MLIGLTRTAGGIALKTDKNSSSEGDWGYTFSEKEDFLCEYGRIVKAIFDSDILSGFCYTQLADIEQEKNGLLDDRHNFKFLSGAIKEINDAKTL